MGFAGGSFFTRAQTIIYRLYQGPERVKALTFFALCVVAGARTSGALIGGYLTEWFSWRAIFFLNLPFAITAIVILAICLPNLRLKHSLKKIDWPGLLFLAGWVAPIQIILSRGERNDWFADPMIRWLAVCASVCLILFILCELRPGERSPIITLRNYTHRNFVVGSLYVVVLGMILFGQLWAVPQFLRNVQHHSAWETGVLQTFNAAGFFVGLVAGSILMNRIGVKFALAAGAAIFCGGMLIWATRLSVGMSDAAMLLPLALTGVGAGWQLGPLSRLINGETPPELLGEGMELYLYQRQLAGSWGIAILTIMVDHRRSFWSERLGEHIDTYSSLLQEQLRLGAKALQGAGLTSSQADAVSLGIVHGRLLQQSVVNAFMETFYYQAALGAFALFLIFAFCYRRHVLAVVRWSSGLIRWTR